MSHYEVVITGSDDETLVRTLIPFESRELYRCGVGFNPSADSKIDRIKIMFAAAMHEVESYRAEINSSLESSPPPHGAPLDGLDRAHEAISFAGNQLESAQMFAVKAYVAYKKAKETIEAARGVRLVSVAQDQDTAANT